MAAKAMLIRPNVAALRLVGNCACPLSFLRRTSSMMTATMSYNPSSGRSLFMGLLPISNLACPFRRNFCIRATTDSDNPANIESPLMETMEKKIKEHLSAESAVVKDVYGDSRHVREVMFLVLKLQWTWRNPSQQ